MSRHAREFILIMVAVAALSFPASGRQGSRNQQTGPERQAAQNQQPKGRQPKDQQTEDQRADSDQRTGPQQGSQEQQTTPRVQVPWLNIQSHTMSNGLRVILLEDHAVPVVDLQVWYHVGSKDELAGHTGFAHLFEHLMFKGSAHVGADQHSRIIEAVGGFDNAYTNDDVTVFYETFPSNYLARVLWLEADRMGSLNVDEANFISERKVVEEERRVRVDNQPYGLVQEDLYAAAFKVHPYHHTTIGSIADLEKATLEEVREFHQTYYRPDNATVIIAGDLNPTDTLRSIHKYFDGIPRPAAAIPRNAKPEPAQQGEIVAAKSYANAPLPAVVEGYKVPAAFTPDSYPLTLAANILSNGESSWLYRTLVYQDRIAVQTAGFGRFTEDPNLFWALAVMNQGHTAEEGEKAIDAVLAKMKSQPVDASDLEKAKNQEIAGFILGRDTDEDKAAVIGEAAVIGKDAELVNSEPGKYLGVLASEIQRVTDHYFVKTDETLLLVTPQQPSKPGQQQSKPGK